MRFVILGGMFFIGPAIIEELLATGHEVVTVTRGLHRGPEVPEAPHHVCDRFDEAALTALLGKLRPAVIVDTCAYTRAAAEILVRARPARARLVVLSSMDVYRAFGSLLAGACTDAVPLDESSPVREHRYLYRDRPDVAELARHLPGVDPEVYEKLEVEEVFAAADATILRLPVVFGPRDPLRREEMLLRRVRAGRARIPFGTGNLLWTRGYVGDVARAVRLAGERKESGEILNVGERRTMSMRLWATEVLRAAGSEAELVQVPDDHLPPDLFLAGAFAQHVVVDSARAREVLGWHDSEPSEVIAKSVRWHLAHPPEDTSDDFSADDAALAEGATCT